MDYNINDIESLTFRDGVRKRIEIYLGSADMQGAYNAIQEIISNSIDEFYMGYGKEIEIILGLNNLVTIQDQGRGIPFGIKEDGCNVLVDVFSKSHTGGKFNSKVYQSVAGLNGLGGKATCLSSEKFLCESYREGRMAKVVFEKGFLIDYKEEDLPGKEKGKTGTLVSFILDQEVFKLEPITIDFEVLCEKCKSSSYLTKGLKFKLEDRRTVPFVKKEYLAKHGIVQLLTDTVENPINKRPLYYEIEQDGIFLEVAVQWGKNRYERGYIFTNGLYNSEGGTPVTGIRTAITRTINKDFKTSFVGEAARSGLNYAVNIKIPNPSFANQTKNKVNNPQLRGLADKAFVEGWKDFCLSSPDEVLKIKDFLIKEEKADKAAEKARSAVINSTKEIESAQKKKVILGSKLKDCELHGEEATLIICEGDSALGGLSQGRSVENFALLPIRGKIINCFRNDMEKIMENEEVKTILTCLGCGMQEKYNPKKLRYGKIAIATDGDADGYNIMCLILTMVRELLPKFLEEGRLCWLRAPLYKIDYKGKETMFAFNDEELNAIIKKNGKGSIKRFKGLGEMNPDDTQPSMFGKYQRLERFVINNDVETYQQLQNLMGEDVEFRKDFIFKNIDFSVLEE